jgi:tetratricopeptide (TPR) repeat protein
MNGEKKESESNKEGEGENEWDEATLKISGTDKQEKIMMNYPSITSNDKIKIPYIEKMNGNISIKCMKPSDSEEDIKGSYTVAISFYNKSLLALKMIFEQDYKEKQVVLSMSDSTGLIKDVELPVKLNLGLCYMKIE